jgi:hypothetical protein
MSTPPRARRAAGWWRALGTLAALAAVAALPGCRCAAFLHSFDDDYACTTDEDCAADRVCVPRSDTGEGVCVLGGRDGGADAGSDASSDAAPCTAGAPCDDGDACTTGDTCDGSGTCVAGAPVDCTPLDGACTQGVCDPTSGGCTATPINEGGACNDGQYCTDPDVCTAGTCGGGARGCADTSPCTIDSCDEAVDVCVHDAAPLQGMLCDDGLFCTVGESCSGGVCGGGSMNSCADLEGCTTDSCNEALDTCANVPLPDGTMCAAAGGCLLGGTCSGGACSAVTPAGGGTPCDDADYCTTVDLCDGAGNCLGTSPPLCEDLNFCTTNVCAPASGCTFPAVANGTSCDDGQFCTTGETCTSGACGGGGGTDCSAVADQCNGASCDEGANACAGVPVADFTPCSDGLFCWTGEACIGGACSGGAANPCPDGNQCTSDTCDEAGDACLNPMLTDGTACDDGLYCNTGETCTGGACMGGATPCGDGNVCTMDVCDESANSCSYPAEANGAPCSDGIACTSPDGCQSGACVGGPETDSLCPMGQLCRLACFGGCGTPPASLTVSCPSPTTLVAGSGTSNCSVDLAGVAGQAGCLSCSAAAGIDALAFSDFATCTTDGWTSTGDPASCPPPFGGDAMAAENSVPVLERTFDTTGLDNVWLCFDYADQGATGSDFLRVEMFGGTCTLTYQVMEEFGGPRIGATDDGTYFHYCFDLDVRNACAANNAALTLRFTGSSFGSGRWLAWDNVWVGGADDACVVLSDALLQSSWTCGAGSLGGWTVESGTPLCNATPDEVRADNNSWQARRCVNVSAYDTDVYLDFLYGETNADEAGTAEGLDVWYNPACDGACTCPAGSWTKVFTHQSALLSTTTNVRRFFVNLSALDPAVDHNPSLGIRVAMSAGSGGRQVRLDDFRVGGLLMMCVPPDVTVGAPMDSGGGTYAVSATSTSGQAVEIMCSWDTPPLPIEDADGISYLP